MLMDLVHPYPDFSRLNVIREPGTFCKWKIPIGEKQNLVEIKLPKHIKSIGEFTGCFSGEADDDMSIYLRAALVVLSSLM